MQTQFRNKITVPAHIKNEKLIDWCYEHGYTHLGIEWQDIPKGGFDPEWHGRCGFHIFVKVETYYPPPKEKV